MVALFLGFLQIEIDDSKGAASDKLRSKHPGIHNASVIRMFGVTEVRSEPLGRIFDGHVVL
jgi:hypothetical protein